MKPATARTIHLVLMVFWFCNLPPVVIVYLYAPGIWRDASILYLALVSIYANFVGHWSGYSAERPTEIHQEEGEQATNTTS